jgi:hypothetical protein
MSCCPPGSGVQCDTVQIIEPDESLPVGTAGGTADPTLQERGEVVLSIGQSEVSVVFAAVKASEVYRFEYLYVDAFGIINPGGILPTVQAQSKYGFTVDLAGSAPAAGYVLRWRVVVVLTSITPSAVDTPENLRVRMPFHFGTIPVPLPPEFSVLTVPFVNQRSNVNYGFSELRVENLDDDPIDQVVVNIQVVEKNLGDFTITFNPVPPTANYYLVARTP